MSRLISNEKPGKSIIFAVEKKEEYVDYYVSNEKEFIEIGKRDTSEKLGKDVSELEVVKPIPKSKGYYKGGSYTEFKSNLYRMGGICYDNSMFGETRKTVKKFDWKSMEWVSVPDMNMARTKPYPVILGEDLYVVGGLSIDDEEDTSLAVLMEVLNRDGSGWTNISNPPRSGEKESEAYYRDVYGNVIAGTVKIKNNDVIIVGITYHQYTYELYTYDAVAEVNTEEEKWMFYSKIIPKNDPQGILYCCRSNVVVYDQWILYLGQTYDDMLCIMDLAKKKLDMIDLNNHSVIPVSDSRISGHCFLVMIDKEQRKLCYFWSVFGKNNNKMLKACIFTLERNTNTSIGKKEESQWCAICYPPRYNANANCAFSVTIISRWSSLIPGPDLDPHLSDLSNVCLVDYVPDLSSTS